MEVAPDALAYLAAISDGDARVALNNLEAVTVWIQKNKIRGKI
jgi:replication-associated recombination protein RarA